ncbi:MAG: hypothetical protein GX625_08745, partial [Clostridiaceae bacterium]|nr:hypothetical protein [Clostridiaceae bacterium]
MWLQNNPFYILSVTCRDSRRAIASAADKLSFIYDASACDEAQNLLLIPSRRLSAELDWFIDLSREEIEEIRICIKNQDPIPTDTLTSLSALNATLYNFAIAEKTDYLEIGYALFDIDEQYTDLNIREITRMINDCHSSAKMADVQEQDVSLELGKKREDIRQIINEKLSVLNDETYTELITMLAEKYIASEDDGVILSDIVDQYEIRMQSVIEESTEHIKSHIDRIKHLANDDVVEDSLKELIGRVQNWDKLVQPLQLKSMATGMPHAISEDLGRELRKLALYLHNEQGKTEESLALVEAMQDIFAELGNLTEIFNDDSDVLKDLIQGDKDFEEVLAELDSLEKSADSVKEYPSKPNIDSLITRVKALDIKIKSLEIDDELKIKIRGNVCYMARIVAINLHNDKQQTTH